MKLRHEIGREEFDYAALMAALSPYARPRDRVTRMLRRGDIIRVKKGIYVFGEESRRRPYSVELLANLICGPSYVSLDSALAYHGLTPERVDATTSVTTGRPRTFDTPVGRFVYRPAPIESFHLGMDRVASGDVAFLIATPERALADKIREDRGTPLRTLTDAEEYLLENLRIDPEALARLDPEFLEELAKRTRSRKIAVCADWLRKRSPER